MFAKGHTYYYQRRECTFVGDHYDAEGRWYKFQIKGGAVLLIGLFRTELIKDRRY